MSCSHCISTDSCIHYGLFNSTVDYSIIDHSEKQETAITNSYIKDDWIVVIYENIWYPGYVMETKNNTLITKFMARKNNIFTWPKHDDIQTVLPTQVLCKIDAPLKCDQNKLKQKLAFKFAETVYKDLNNAAATCKIYQI